jgi:hypothetical protein
MEEKKFKNGKVILKWIFKIYRNILAPWKNKMQNLEYFLNYYVTLAF